VPSACARRISAVNASLSATSRSISGTLIRRVAASTAIPSSANRMLRSSRKRGLVIITTRIRRFGRISSAPSAASRRTASRTGIGLTPSAVANSRNVSFWPG
jgi:hypothetical protein